MQVLDPGVYSDPRIVSTPGWKASSYQSYWEDGDHDSDDAVCRNIAFSLSLALLPFASILSPALGLVGVGGQSSKLLRDVRGCTVVQLTPLAIIYTSHNAVFFSLH